jgi:hypothetical protein
MIGLSANTPTASITYAEAERQSGLRIVGSLVTLDGGPVGLAVTVARCWTSSGPSRSL